MHRCTVIAVLVLLGSVVEGATIEDVSSWTLLQDPPHAGLTASIEGSEVVRLTAAGAVPTGADIGYASINGADVASSSAGYYFDPATDFSVAIDFNLSGMSSIGAGGIGFGIGEDVGGANSAGIGLGFLNGAAVLFATAGRVNDVDQAIESVVAGFGQGRLFVEYISATGDVVVGVNATQGTPAPSVVRSLSGIQNQWDDEPLLVSFFLRSQALSPFPALSGGQVDAIFSSFDVLNGTPITIPEPTTSFLAALALSASWRFPRQR